MSDFPFPGHSATLTPAIGVQGDMVSVAYGQMVTITMTPASARAFARDLLTMASIIDPPKETREPNPPEIPGSGKAVDDGGAGGGDEVGK